MADTDRGRLIDQTGIPSDAALREDVIEQHGIDTTDGQIAVWMHVVFVGHGDEAVLLTSRREQVVGERRSQGGNAASGQVGKRLIPGAIGGTDCEDLLELVVRNGDRESLTPRRTVFDTAQSDIEVLTCGRG